MGLLNFVREKAILDVLTSDSVVVVEHCEMMMLKEITDFVMVLSVSAVCCMLYLHSLWSMD